jgi:16S rRNA (cytidine1402-2'-O)-methyltransferase
VRAAVDAGIAVVPVPGASALLSALVASGMNADRFTFYGFLPRKGQARTAALAELASLPHTAVVYEAPTRLAESLADLEARGAGGRMIAVAREMTKQYEEVRRGTVSALRAYYDEAPPRGEVVLVIAGAEPRGVEEQEVRTRARELVAEGRTARDVVAQLIAELGVARNRAYAIVEEERNG